MDALVRLGQLALDCPEIAEIEVNPLRALPEGKGACAIDVTPDWARNTARNG